MNQKVKILISLITMLIIPSLAFAENNSYNAIESVSMTMISVIQWLGFALAVRNTYIHRYQICDEWSK